MTTSQHDKFIAPLDIITFLLLVAAAILFGFIFLGCGSDLPPDEMPRPQATDAQSINDADADTDAGGIGPVEPDGGAMEPRCSPPLIWGSCLDGREQCRRKTGSVVLYDSGPDVVLDGLCDDNFTVTARLEDHHLAIEAQYDADTLRLVIENVRAMEGALPEPPCTGELLSGCQHKSGLLQFQHRVSGVLRAELSYAAFRPELTLSVEDTTFAPGTSIHAQVYASILVTTERGPVPRILTLDVSTFMSSQ